MTDPVDRIEARIAADGRGTVTVAGRSEELAGWEPEVTKRVIVARLVDLAHERGRPVELELDQEAGGAEVLRVHPSGVVEPLTGTTPPSPAADAAAPTPARRAPTVQDLLTARPAAPEPPATQGWRGRVARATGLRLSPGAAEVRHRAAVQQ